jgi:hypothetical protein
MASPVPNLKDPILDEDVKTGASASEATMFKIAGNANKSIEEDHRNPSWMANGFYWITAAPEMQVDRQWRVPFDCEIHGLYAFNKTAGASGVTEIDIEKHQPGDVWTTIFSTRPAFDFSSGDDAELSQTFTPAAVTDYASAGVTEAVLASTDLNAGDILRMNFIDKQTSYAEGFGIQLLLRAK